MTEFTCQPHVRHRRFLGLIPYSDHSPHAVDIDGRILHFDFATGRILEDTSTEIARLEPFRPGMDRLQSWEGVIHFSHHALVIHHPIFSRPSGRLKCHSQTIAEWKFAWASSQLHLEGVGSFENPEISTVTGRCIASFRETGMVVAAFWLTFRLASDSSGPS